MQTNKFDIIREYVIKCKAFTPDEGNVDSVIIGVHGFAGDKDSSMLRKLAKSVCQKNTALICFDFPSHGESPVAEDMLTVDNCKNDLIAVADHVKNKYPNAEKSIFATSFGGYIALLCSSQLCGFSLVLRAPAVTMPKILLETVLRISDEDFKKAGAVTCGFERLLSLPYSFSEDLKSQPDLCAIKLSLPTLIIHGDMDDTVPPCDVFDFVKTQKNVRLEIIKGADHRFKNAGETEKIIDLASVFLNI